MTDPLNSRHFQQRCRRCGTCCRNGGPALHRVDQELVISGNIQLKHLFTIRQGEPAYDNVRHIIAPAPTDIIKIKAANESNTTCRFFEHAPAGCRIYVHRPIECRELMCWDTRAILAIYNQDRLTRTHLLHRLPGLEELVSAHQQRCDYQQVAALTQAIKDRSTDSEAVEQLVEVIRYDLGLRQATLDRTRLNPEILEFLFGLPLTHTIGRFGVKLVKRKGRTTVAPSNSVSALPSIGA